MAVSLTGGGTRPKKNPGPRNASADRGPCVPVSSARRDPNNHLAGNDMGQNMDGEMRGTHSTRSGPVASSDARYHWKPPVSCRTTPLIWTLPMVLPGLGCPERP